MKSRGSAWQWSQEEVRNEIFEPRRFLLLGVIEMQICFPPQSSDPIPSLMSQGLISNGLQ